MAELEIVQGGDWLRYKVSGGPSRYIKASANAQGVSLKKGEIAIDGRSIIWAREDGSGGVESVLGLRQGSQNISFSGASGDGTTELAAGGKYLKMRLTSGDGLVLRGDQNAAAGASNLQLSQSANGIKIDWDVAEEKYYLPQTFLLYKKDDTEVGFRQPFEINNGYIDTGVTDGTQYTYFVEENITLVGGATDKNQTTQKSLTFDDSAVDPPDTAPTTAPDNVNLQIGATQFDPPDIRVSWDNTNLEDQINIVVQESPNFDGPWTGVAQGTAGAATNQINFGPQSGLDTWLRARVNYFNSDGSGPVAIQRQANFEF